MRVFGRSSLAWKGGELFVGGRGSPMAEIVRDPGYPGMWRFRLLPDGELSDMVNLTRAKDAACSHVLGVLNKGEELPHAGAYIAQTPSGAPWGARTELRRSAGAPVAIEAAGRVCRADRVDHADRGHRPDRTLCSQADLIKRYEYVDRSLALWLLAN